MEPLPSSDVYDKASKKVGLSFPMDLYQRHQSFEIQLRAFSIYLY